MRDPSHHTQSLTFRFGTPTAGPPNGVRHPRVLTSPGAVLVSREHGGGIIETASDQTTGDAPEAGRKRGLTSDEIEALRRDSGWNELAAVARTSPLVVALRQFTNLLVVILIVAALAALALGERIDALTIGLVVVLNGVLGFVQEWRAETAIEALRAMLSPTARVIRNGRAQEIEARALVPGDLVLLEAGDRVPADIRPVIAAALRVDESVLTGESVAVDKDARDPEARLYMGTAVAAGRAEGVVTAIGAATRFGQIAHLTGSVGEKVTHLQRTLARLARQLGFASLAIGAAVLAVGIATGRPLLETVMTGLSLAVAMVPEGLPAVVTVTLALGASAMARQKALARRLQAVETLGAASVICTDKTGTLTENKMTAVRVVTPGARYDVTGTGYDPAGHIACGGRRVRAEDDPGLAALLDAALVCNNARLERTGHDWTLVGEATEGALVTLALKGWAPPAEQGEVLAERPFDSDRKRMSVVARRRGALRLLVKGAPEAVLGAATRVAGPDGVRPLDDAARAEIAAAYAELADEGLRVMALRRARGRATRTTTPRTISSSSASRG